MTHRPDLDLRPGHAVRRCNRCASSDCTAFAHLHEHRAGRPCVVVAYSSTYVMVHACAVQLQQISKHRVLCGTDSEQEGRSRHTAHA